MSHYEVLVTGSHYTYHVEAASESDAEEIAIERAFEDKDIKAEAYEVDRG